MFFTYFYFLILVVRSCAPSGVPGISEGCSEMDIKEFGGKTDACFCKGDLCNGAGTVAISMMSLVMSFVLVKLL